VKKEKFSYKYILISAGTILGLLLIWETATDVLRLIPAVALPSPVEVAKTLLLKMTDTAPDGATIPQHLATSLKVALSGYSIGVIVGVPLGIAMAWYPKFALFAQPLFDLIRPIPGIAWIPLMIIFFGIGLLSKAMVVFTAAFISCVVNSFWGIRQTRDVHLWVGQTFGAGNFQLLWNVAIPTALPMIFTGMRIALGVSWSGLVVAELLASTRGLGFMIQQCRGLYRPDVIIAGMIAIGFVGAVLSYLLSWVERIFLKGRKES